MKKSRGRNIDRKQTEKVQPDEKRLEQRWKLTSPTLDGPGLSVLPGLGNRALSVHQASSCDVGIIFPFPQLKK